VSAQMDLKKPAALMKYGSEFELTVPPHSKK